MVNFLKSVQLRGNLKDQFLTYKPTPSEFAHFKKSVCFLRVENVSFNCPLEVNTCCSISCNYVTNEGYSSKDEIVLYEQCLQYFLLKGKNVIRFSNSIWFPMETLCYVLKVQLIDSLLNTPVKTDCSFCLTLSFGQ